MSVITKGDFNKYFDDIDDWTKEAIDEYRNAIEISLSEVHDRERQLLDRSGALLSMNGVILTLIASFGMSPDIPTPSLNLVLLSIILIVLSSCTIGWVIIPPYRSVISSTSGKEEYIKYYKENLGLKKAILLERLHIYETTLNKNSTNSDVLSIGLVLLTMGLVSLGLSLILTRCDPDLGLYSCIAFALIAIVSLVFMIHRMISKR